MKTIYALYIKNENGVYQLFTLHKTMDGATKEMQKYKMDAYIYELPLRD